MTSAIGTRRFALVAIVAAMSLVAAASAAASWNAGGGSGSAYSKARSLNGTAAPNVTVSGRRVTVSWTDPGGPVPATGYLVKRYNNADVQQTIGAACAGTVSGTSCAESGVPPGSWKYRVTSARGAWRGPESAASAVATVGSPGLTISSPPVNSFPTVLSGSISNFVDGQTVTYRLDDPNTGTILTGGITPSPVPNNGSATVSVTIPAGTGNGSHTVYAIGSGGDQASAPITVDAPKVTASVIGKSAGGRPGRIRQGGTYRIFANVSGSGGPPAGLAGLTANVSNVTTGQTAVAMTYGSYTAGGQSYNYRSGILTANASLSEGTKPYTTTLTDNGGTVTVDNFTVIVDNTRPNGSDIQAANTSGGIAGRAELGDTMTFTYSEQMDEGSFLAGWTGASTNVVLRLNQSGAGDNVQIWNATNTTQLPLGQVNLGRTDYTTTSRTFGLTGTPSTMVMSGNSITVTLGTASGTVSTAAAPSTMVWAPSATATDAAGNAALTTATSETGPSDLNF